MLAPIPLLQRQRPSDSIIDLYLVSGLVYLAIVRTSRAFVVMHAIVPPMNPAAIV
jgi:hypothetical protein